jgi:hypothetical protein
VQWRTVTIHDYKLLELNKMSIIGPECYAEAMKIAPGQQRFRGAFRHYKAKYGIVIHLPPRPLDIRSIGTAVLLHQVPRSRF